MKKSIHPICSLSLMGTLLFITPATAQTVTGSASVSGNITISATGVFFNASGSNSPANPLKPYSGNPNSGSFSGLTSGAIKNLPGVTAPGPLAIKGFATFNTPSGTIVFDLQSAAPGSGSTQACANAAIGNVCTPAGSPLTVIQTAANATAIELVLKGIAYPATAGPGSAGTTMSLTIVTVSIGTISGLMPIIATPSGIRLFYSATLTTP